MSSDRLKSILAIIAYAFIFIASEVFGALFKGGPTILLTLVYPSLAFWIALILTIIIERKKLINRDMFIQTCILAILFLWAASFVMSAMHSPVTAFMSADKIPFKYQIWRLPSIALLKTGWFLMLVIILLWYRQKGEMGKLHEKSDDTSQRHK